MMRPTPLSARRRQRRRAMIFLEMLPTLILVAAVMSMAAVLLGQTWKLDRRLAAESATDRTTEHIVQAIRRDAASARTYTFVDDIKGISFDDGNVVWRATDSEITRAERSGQRVAWRTGKAPLIFEVRPGGFAVLTLESGDRSRESVVVVPSLWASEALK